MVTFKVKFGFAQAIPGCTVISSTIELIFWKFFELGTSCSGASSFHMKSGK